MRLPGFLQFTPHERKAILALLLFTGGGGLLIEAGRRFPVYFSGLRAADAVSDPGLPETGPDSLAAAREPVTVAGTDRFSAGDSIRGSGPVPGSIAWSALSPAREGDSGPPVAERGRTEKKTPDVPIDINKADEKTLTLLPGIGPRIASRIVAERLANGPYRHVDDLDRVKGIGPATLARLRPMITAG